MKNNLLRAASMMLLVIIIGVAITPICVNASAKNGTFKAYRKWLQNTPEGYNYFALIYIDNDGTPELVAKNDGYDEYGTSEYILCGCKNGKIQSLAFSDGDSFSSGYRSSASFIPKKNKVYNGHMYGGNGEGEDGIFKLNDNGFQEVEKGKYDYKEMFFSWNGKTMTENEYNSCFTKAYDSNSAKGFWKIKYYTKEEIIKKIDQKMN